MRFPTLALATLATLVTAALGCRCPSGCCIPATPHIACNLQTTAAPSGPPDVMLAIPECDAEECGLQKLPVPGDQFHALSPADCQCRAAANANVANMVELEEHWATVTIECDSKIVARNLCLQRDLLELHAADVRNKAAGAALEIYYQLAGLEARRHFLDSTLDEARQSYDRATKVRNAGLPETVDRDEIAAQVSALEDRSVQLDLVRVQLNGRLQHLLGCPISENDFFWPQVDWTPDLAPLDADAELQSSLANRYDLRGIGLVLCKMEKPTIRVARGVLAVADGTLGSVEPTEGWIHKLRCIACSELEVDVRCRQLAMLYENAESVATAEIKGAVYEVLAQQHRLLLARDAVKARRARLYELTSKRDVDNVQIFEISRMRSRLYEAESNLVDQSVGLKTALVRLKQAEALLAAECGFNPKLCCEGCCDGACTHCQTRTCCPGELPCRCKKCGTCTK